MAEHISYTQINTYLQCPLKYRFQYIDQIEWPFVPSGLVFGTAIHKVAAYYYQKKMQGTELSPKKLSEVFQQWWKQENQDKNIQFKPQENYNKLLTKGIQLIQILVTSQNGNQIVAVEKEFKTPLIHPTTKETLAVPLVGFIDLIEKNPDGSFVIVDLKTANRAFTQDRIINDLQMTCYSYVAHYHKLNQKKPVHLRFDVLLKNRECEKLEYTVRRSERDHQRLFQTAQKILHAIEQKIFFPNSGFYCTDCPFFQNCQNW